MAQAIAIQGVDMRPGLREIMEQNAVQPACADAFFLLMQQMLEQGQSTDMLLTQMKNEAEKDSEEIGAQTASEMLYMLPYAQLFPTLQTSSSLSEIVPSMLRHRLRQIQCWSSMRPSQIMLMLQLV